MSGRELFSDNEEKWLVEFNLAAILVASFASF
jgi:hypothetical protein